MKTLTFVLGILLLVQLPATVAQTTPPTIDATLSTMGFEAGAKARLLNGEILSKDLAEGSDKELAAVVVFRIRAPLSKVMEAAHTGKTLQIEPEILGFGKADSDLAKLGYTAAEASEALAALNSAPGSRFNFSKAEFDRWRALKAKLNGADPRKDPQALEAVNAEYRSILTDRLTAYQKGGVAAVAPYSRGKNEAKPAEELALATRESPVGKAFPDFEKAIADYPAGSPGHIDQEYLWIKQRVEKRPVMILAHRMYLQEKDHVVAMERQIYVGASYNCQQSMVGAREEDGVVFAAYGNRCFTDQVAGAMSGMKHGIGRGQMIDELKAHFERVRQMLEK